MTVGFHGMAAATAWARVEAGKHHVTDVLAGYALGHFIGRFTNELFMEATAGRAGVDIVPVDGGWALTLKVKTMTPAWQPGLPLTSTMP